MYDDYSMDGIEDLLDFFDTERTAKTIEQQIMTDEFGLDAPIDYYRPYYTKFKTLEVDIDNGITESMVSACRHKAKVIALMFIEAILKKFNLHIDEFWIDNMDEAQLQGVTIVLYDFFILHLREYLLEVITRYIDANSKMLADQFEHNPRIARDASLSAFLKVVDEDYAVIGANVYDVCFLTLNNLNEIEYINHINADNEIQPHIKRFFEEGKISGNFIDVLEQMMADVSNGLKSHMGFEIVAYIKRAHAKNLNQ